MAEFAREEVGRAVRDELGVAAAAKGSPLHFAVNDMDNAMYEIDIYEPGLFIRIARKLGDVISECE